VTCVNQGQTNRLLGYPVDARLLIINADDFGMFHAVNAAIFRALKHGVLHSTTLMVPCPWALHAMHFLADHPEISLPGFPRERLRLFGQLPARSGR
jgi:YdjC-like protein